MNMWRELLELIDNHYKCGLIKITRKALLKYFYPKRKHNEILWTLDNYRRYLTKAGYLVTLKPGVYEILKSPLGKTLRSVKTEAYPIAMIIEKFRNQENSLEFLNFKEKIDNINSCEYHLNNLIDCYKNDNTPYLYIKNWFETIKNIEINRVKDCIGIEI